MPVPMTTSRRLSTSLRSICSVRPAILALTVAASAACLKPAPGAGPGATTAAAPAAAGPSVVLASQDDLDTRAEGGVATFADSAAPAEAGGGRGVAIVFASKPAREWDVEMAAHGLALAPGVKYRLSFWAKARAERGLLVDISEDGAPWNALGFARRFSVGTTWTRLETDASLTMAPKGQARVCFKLGGAADGLELAGFKLEGPSGAGPGRAAPVAREGAATAEQGQLTFRQEGGVATQTPDVGPPDAPGGGAPGSAMTVTFSALPKRFWDVEVTAHDVAVHRGGAYKITFWAKAAAPRPLYLDVSHDGPPYSSVGYEETLSLGTAWKKHEIAFIASGNPRPVGRVVFKMGHATDAVSIAGFQFRPAQPAEVPVIDKDKVVDGALPAALEARVRETINETRQGPIKLSVVDDQGRAVAGAEVRVKLVKHRFLFGQTLPHRDWTPGRRLPWQEKFLALWEPITTLVVPENSTKGGQWNHNTKPAESIWALARDRGLAFKSHAPIWGWEYPEYRKATTWDCARIKADVQPRLEAQLAMFKGHHAYSDLANEMVSAPYIQEQCASEGGEKLLIDWYKRAHELDPAVKLTINDYDQTRGRGTRVDDLVKRFKAAGVAVAAQGEQFHDQNMWYPPDEVWGLLDRLAANGVEVHLTEITQPDDGATIRGGYVDGVVWNSGNQAAFLKQTYRLAFGHPAVESIVMWNFWDGASWRPRGGIVDQAFQPKPSYQVLHDLITREWSTDLALKTSARGEAGGRGFYGTYEVTVTAPGRKSQTFRQTLDKGPAPTAAWKLQLARP